MRVGAFFAFRPEIAPMASWTAWEDRHGRFCHAQPDSDYDIAVFLRDMTDQPAEMNRLADLATDVLYDGGPFIHAMPYRAGSYNDARIPLMHEIRAEGIDL